MLNNVISDLKETKRLYEYEMQMLPEGELNAREQKGRHYYTHRLPVNGNRKKVVRNGISSDSELVQKLVRKKYLKKALLNIDADLAVLETAAHKYKNVDAASVMADFIAKYPELADGLCPRGMTGEAWAKDFVPKEDFYETGKKSTSGDGTKMRSKGEIVISGRLDLYKIPYRYESDVAHPDVSRVPDFTIRRPRDGKLIYWEHLGLTDDEGYMDTNAAKFAEYEANDIVPWDNLIITYDQKDGGIDVKIIDAMIQGWLL